MFRGSKFRMVNSSCKNHSPISHCERAHAFLADGHDASVESVVAFQEQPDDCMPLDGGSVDMRCAVLGIQTSFFLSMDQLFDIDVVLVTKD